MNIYYSPNEVINNSECYIQYINLQIKNIGNFKIKSIENSSGFFWMYINDIISSPFYLIFYPFYIQSQKFYLFTDFYLNYSYKYNLHLTIINNFDKDHIDIINKFLDYRIVYKILVKKSGYSKSALNNFIKACNILNIRLSKQEIINIINEFIDYIKALNFLNDIK